MHDIDVVQEVHAARDIERDVLALLVPRQLPRLPCRPVVVVQVQRASQVAPLAELCTTPAAAIAVWSRANIPCSKFHLDATDSKNSIGIASRGLQSKLDRLRHRG